VLSDQFGLQDVLLARTAGGPRSFGGLVAGTRVPAVARAHLLHLLWQRRLGLDLTRPLTDRSLAWRPSTGVGPSPIADELIEAGTAVRPTPARNAEDVAAIAITVHRGDDPWDSAITQRSFSAVPHSAGAMSRPAIQRSWVAVSPACTVHVREVQYRELRIHSCERCDPLRCAAFPFVPAAVRGGRSAYTGRRRASPAPR